MEQWLKKAVLICLALAMVAVAACDKTKWRSKEFGGTPPSWEHDLGRPDGYGGEDPWR